MQIGQLKSLVSCLAHLKPSQLHRRSSIPSTTGWGQITVIFTATENLQQFIANSKDISRYSVIGSFTSNSAVDEIIELLDQFVFTLTIRDIGRSAD
ncbi:hypothetical protein NPIL_15401 [Nephila pilipes]|uniref:Uncharacterized protein n=1 Tax=Nephila pilipes TaxID=299642 RepID=A0A8X6PX85_NEPPI|nr:hypothetical protein NPIL_15401 [Nephila pilipes]